MSNKAKSSKSTKNITKISANQPKNPAKPQPKPQPKSQPKPKKSPKTTEDKPLKEVFLLARPFVALGRYLRDSWREIRQVRWPGRKLTWKMTLAVLIYCAIFIAFIVLLDTFFSFLFNLLLNTN